jgi:tetratricopeptide (TPR) repeat protein
MVVGERHQFDQAEQWYLKALEVFERLGHPPLQVDTLAQLGLLNRELNRFPEAVACLGQALQIAAQFQMRVESQILVDLARLMKEMGREEFTAAWKQAFEGEEPPLDTFREILKQEN